jgi:hypothetical protein
VPELVELLIDEGVFDEIAGGIDFQNRLNDSRFAAGELRVGVLVCPKPLLRVRRTKKLQKAFVVPFFSGSLQLAGLGQSIRKDLRFQSVPGCMFDQRITRFELPVFRYVTDAKNDRPRVRSNLEAPGFRSEQIQDS